MSRSRSRRHARRMIQVQKREMKAKPWYRLACFVAAGFTEHDFESYPSNTTPDAEMLYCEQCGLKVEFDTPDWQYDRKVKPLSVIYTKAALDGTIFTSDRSAIHLQMQITRYDDARTEIFIDNDGSMVAVYSP